METIIFENRTNTKTGPVQKQDQYKDQYKNRTSTKTGPVQGPVQKQDQYKKWLVRLSDSQCKLDNFAGLIRYFKSVSLAAIFISTNFVT